MGPGHHITLKTASKFYPFLTQDKWVREDVKQTANLVDIIGVGLPDKELIRLANRELYRLARDLGWRKVNKPNSWDSKTWQRENV